MCVRAQDLARPEATYRALGAKLIVGMPFKDQATSDSLLLPRVPPAADRAARRALARLQARLPACTRRLLGHTLSAVTMAVAGAEQGCAAAMLCSRGCGALHKHGAASHMARALLSYRLG